MLADGMKWTPANLEVLTSDPDVWIRKWAVLRLAGDAIEETEEILIRLLASSVDPNIRLAAAGRLARRGTRACLPALMEVFRQDGGEIGGHCAVGVGRLGGEEAADVLLDRWQEGPSESEQEGILLGLAENGSSRAFTELRHICSNSIGKTDPVMAWHFLVRKGRAEEMRWAVGWYRNKEMEQAPELLGMLIEALDVQTGAGHFRRLIAEGGGRAVVNEWSTNYAPYLEALHLPPLDLPDLRYGRDVTRLLTHLTAIARSLMAGIPADSPFRVDAGRHAAVVDALSAPEPWDSRGRLRDEALDIARMEAGLALAAVERLLHLAMAAHRFEAAANPSAGKDELLAVWIVDLAVMPSLVTDRMAALGPAVLPELTEAVRDWPQTRVAARSATLLGRVAMQNLDDCDSLVHTLAGGLSAGLEETVDACSNALMAIGAPAVPALARVLAADDIAARAEAFFCLAAGPVPEAAALVSQHWETLVELGPHAMADICRKIASPDLIDLLWQEWRPGEPDLAEILHVLCLLHGRSIPEGSQVEADLEEEAISSEAFRLPLVCVSCGRTYHYEVGTVFVEVESAAEGPDESNVAFQNEVCCKRCGAVDHYRLTGGAISLVMSEMSSAVLLHKMGLESKSVVLHPPLQLMDGRRMGFLQAIANYRDRIALRPGDPELRVRLGNVYRSLRRYHAAQEQYHAAITLEPALPEAYYNLGLNADETGQREEARSHFRKCRDLIATLPTPSVKLLAMARSAAEELGETFVASVQKLGRNDPCPCGSGKKYKKCCGRGA